MSTTSPIGLDDIPVYIDDFPMDNPLFPEGSQASDIAPENTERITYIRNRAIIENNLRYNLIPEKMENLSYNFSQKILHIKTSHSDDYNLLGSLLGRWFNDRVSHKKVPDYITTVEKKLISNAECIKTLEKLHPFLDDAFIKLKIAAETLRSLHKTPDKKKISQFKNMTLKTYEESKRTLEDKVLEITLTLPLDNNFQSHQDHGVVFSAEQEGLVKAIDLTMEEKNSLETYERTIRHSLVCIEMIFEPIHREIFWLNHLDFQYLR